MGFFVNNYHSFSTLPGGDIAGGVYNMPEGQPFPVGK
jgi:hypothetical protein